MPAFLGYASGMKKLDAIAHFGTQVALAEALGIKSPSLASWGDGVPELRQLQLEALTDGVLRAGPECDKYRCAPVDMAPTLES